MQFHSFNLIIIFLYKNSACGICHIFACIHPKYDKPQEIPVIKKCVFSHLKRVPEVDFLGLLESQGNHGHGRLQAANPQKNSTRVRVELVCRRAAAEECGSLGSDLTCRRRCRRYKLSTIGGTSGSLWVASLAARALAQRAMKPKEAARHHSLFLYIYLLCVREKERVSAHR